MTQDDLTQDDISENTLYVTYVEFSENADREEELFNHVATITRKALLQLGEVPPTIYALMDFDRVGFMILSEFHNDTKSKQAQLFSVGTQIGIEILKETYNVLSFYLVSEGWLGTDISTMPSNDPNRVECAFIMKHNIETDVTGGRIMEIVRDPDGKIVDVVDLEQLNESSFDNPLTKALRMGYIVGSGFAGYDYNNDDPVFKGVEE